MLLLCGPTKYTENYNVPLKITIVNVLLKYQILP